MPDQGQGIATQLDVGNNVGTSSRSSYSVHTARLTTTHARGRLFGLALFGDCHQMTAASCCFALGCLSHGRQGWAHCSASLEVPVTDTLHNVRV